MVRNTLITNVRYMVDEPGTTHISATEIENYLNEGQRDMAMRLPTPMLKNLAATLTQNVLQAQQWYTIPHNIIRVIDLSIDGYLAQKVTKQDEWRWDHNAFWEPTATAPAYFLVGKKMKISPVPSSSVTNGLKYTYLACPATLTTTNATPDLASEFHDKLTLFGAFRVRQKDQEWEQSEKWKGEYENWIKEIWTRYPEENR